MPAGVYDFTIEQGAAHITTFVWKTQPGTCCDGEDMTPPAPVDITGYELAMQVRPSAGSPVLYFEATSQNGMLVLVTPEQGIFALNIPEVESAAWTWRRGVYDIALISPAGGVTRLLKGAVTVSPMVTVVTEVEAVA